MVQGGIAFLGDIYSYLELGQGSDVPGQQVVGKCKSVIVPNKIMGSGEQLLLAVEKTLSFAVAAFSAPAKYLEVLSFLRRGYKDGKDTGYTSFKLKSY